MESTHTDLSSQHKSPEGWKVKEEESHSKSNDEQVQDRISFLEYWDSNCDRIFSYDTSITGHDEISYQELVF